MKYIKQLIFGVRIKGEKLKVPTITTVKTVETAGFNDWADKIFKK